MRGTTDVLRRRASGAGLVLAAAVCAAGAAQRVAAARGAMEAAVVERTHPAENTLRPLRAPAPPRSRPRRQVHADPAALLATLDARSRNAEAGVPAAEVDRWIVRLVSTPATREWLESALTRMTRFEPFVLTALRRNGDPDDLLYLAIIESEFKTGAVSRAGATGIWQFMPATGRSYGLEVSDFVDERRDPLRSTVAAARHLSDLHREFGSWHLALAAYNSGSGRVGRLLRRHAGGRRGDEVLYWQIRPYLPGETRTYVPLFLAAAEIARNPRAFGLNPVRLPPLSFREMWVPGGTALADVARATGTPASEVLEMNPHLVRRMTPPGRRWPVRLPLHSTITEPR